MKKIISLALAASMVAGMAMTSFATMTDVKTEPFISENDQLYVWTKNLTDVKGIKAAFIEDTGAEQAYGKTYGIKVNTNGITDEGMKKYSAYAKWSVGEKYIDGKPSLELKKYRSAVGVKEQFNLIAGTASTLKIDHMLTKNTASGVGAISSGWVGTAEVTLPTTANMTAAELKTAIEAAAEAACAPGSFLIGSNVCYGILDPADVALIKAKAVAALTPKYQQTNATETEYEYAWFVTFSTIWDTNYKGNRDIRGEVTVGRTTTTAKDNFGNDKVSKKIDFNGIATDKGNFYILDGDIMDLEYTGSLFTVDTVGISEVINWNGTDFDKDIVAKFPNSELSFYDWKEAKNPTFNRTGTLAFYTENKETKVYEILADGTLKLLESKYDEDLEAVTIRTRTLGNYVLSNTELVLDAPVVDAPVVDAPVVDEPVKENPETGR